MSTLAMVELAVEKNHRNGTEAREDSAMSEMSPLTRYSTDGIKKCVSYVGNTRGYKLFHA